MRFSREAQMSRLCKLVVMVALLCSVSPLPADENDKELRQQRQLAQKERQAQRTERNREISEARKMFSQQARMAKTQNQQRLKELDTEFELQQVELRAAHDIRTTEAEAEYQAKLSGMFLKPGFSFDRQAVERMQQEARSYADAVFALKKSAAEELHKARIASEERKNALLTDSDEALLGQAASLGLTRKYQPILATPIGEGLTDKEQKWNDRETREVEKLEAHNLKMLREYSNGERLRIWEIDVLKEDFKLDWDEKAELQALDGEQNLLSAMMMQPASGAQEEMQGMMSKIAEIGKQRKLITIKYRKIREHNRIRRRQQKKQILDG
jgi:hypothetical protein